MKEIPKRIKHFKKHELACKCCGEFNINEEFLDKLEMARMIAGIPFDITSGCRCRLHNHAVGGNEHSKHKMNATDDGTCAVDIAARNDSERGIIVRALFLAGINQVGVNLQLKFIHAEVDEGFALWIY
jgi:zinc D-Ala-D-Ala carboxypeptidase